MSDPTGSMCSGGIAHCSLRCCPASPSPSALLLPMPFFCRLGADVVVHSLTKFISGASGGKGGWGPGEEEHTSWSMRWGLPRRCPSRACRNPPLPSRASARRSLAAACTAHPLPPLPRRHHRRGSVRFRRPLYQLSDGPSYGAPHAAGCAAAGLRGLLPQAACNWTGMRRWLLLVPLAGVCTAARRWCHRHRMHAEG